MFDENTRYKIMFVFILKMFVGLLSVWALASFSELLASNSQEPIKYVFLSIYCQCQ